MPGGAARLFKALWLQSAGIVAGLLLADLVWDVAFGAPAPNTIAANALVVTCAVFSTTASTWLFRRLPRTAQLVRDLAAAVRPPSPTNPGKA